MNFMVEHLQGHHKNVATPLDPASAEKGQDVYTFGVKSIYNSFWDSWNIEAKRLNKANPNGSLNFLSNKVF